MSIALQIAFARARMVARRSIQRAVEILRAAGKSFEYAVRFVLVARGSAA